MIKRVALDGGPVVAVGPAPGRPFGLSWSDNGYIYFGRGAGGVWRIAAGGGSPEQVSAVEPGQYAHGPQMLPGGEWVIYTRAARVNGWNDAQIVAARPGSAEARVVIPAGHEARWVPGYLTFVHDSQLYAVAFDAERLSTSAEPVLLADGLVLSNMDTTGAAFYALSNSGVLAYIGGRGADAQQMVWKEEGRDTPLPVEPGRISQVRLSPDGRQVAARVYDNGWHIVVYDIDRPTGTKITSDGSNRNPLWSADGDWIYYASDVKGGLDIWKRRADLTGHAELVYGADGNQLPVGLTRKGTLILSTFDQGGSTISEIDPSRPDAVKMLVERLLDASEAAVTPDGRLLAYQTLSGSTWQIRLLDLASGRQRAVADGYSPKWSPDASTLLVQSDRVQNVWRLSLLTIATEPQLSVGASVEFDVPRVEPGCCDLASRTRILVLKPVNSVQAVKVVDNWPDLVRQRR